ncbi:hypothetical protein AB204_02535 [Xenorhabdus khoisanae]|uniref:Uncharacterized protein n=1 Tax=Xenorhabdus khoisanae TaxID=880157 RepID=A0A0J5FXN3_9GAMM|nr:hypothetical protein [Xenorhabdus khoisanae]KMJ46712.1 hypothetical protein AB204_02535 [Xenorhabdus khoisanae]
MITCTFINPPAKGNGRILYYKRQDRETIKLFSAQFGVAFREEINLIREIIQQYLREVAEREALHSILYSGDRMAKINH